MTPDKANLRALAEAAKGWIPNSVHQSDENREDGVAMIGYSGSDTELFEMDDFYETGSVDTGNYDQPEAALPLAQFIVAACSAAVPLLDENDRLLAEVEALRKYEARYNFVLRGLSLEFAICAYDENQDKWYQPSTPRDILSALIDTALKEPTK